MNPTQPRAQAQQTHTPGPWKVAGSCHVKPSGEAGKFYHLAHVTLADDSARNPVVALVEPRGPHGTSREAHEPDPEQEANARLIAAAPELLAALRRVTCQLANLADTVRNTVPIDGAVHAAIAASGAAIAKATEGAK